MRRFLTIAVSYLAIGGVIGQLGPLTTGNNDFIITDKIIMALNASAITCASILAILIGYALDNYSLIKMKSIIAGISSIFSVFALICFIVFETSQSKFAQANISWPGGILFFLTALAGNGTVQLLASYDSINLISNQISKKPLKNPVGVSMCFNELGVLLFTILVQAVLFKHFAVYKDSEALILNNAKIGQSLDVSAGDPKIYYNALVIGILGAVLVISTSQIPNRNLKNDETDEFGHKKEKERFIDFLKLIDYKFIIFILQAGNYGIHLLINLIYVFRRLEKPYYIISLQVFRSTSNILFFVTGKKICENVPPKILMGVLHLLLLAKLLIIGLLDKPKKTHTWVIIGQEILHGIVFGVFYIHLRLHTLKSLQALQKNEKQRENQIKQKNQHKDVSRMRFQSIALNFVNVAGFGTIPALGILAYALSIKSDNNDPGDISWLKITLIASSVVLMSIYTISIIAEFLIGKFLKLNHTD